MPNKIPVCVPTRKRNVIDSRRSLLIDSLKIALDVIGSPHYTSLDNLITDGQSRNCGKVTFPAVMNGNVGTLHIRTEWETWFEEDENA